jgi:hypothetical protein
LRESKGKSVWEGSRRRGDAERERKKAKRKKRDKFSKVVVRREGVSQSGRTGLPVPVPAAAAARY